MKIEIKLNNFKDIKGKTIPYLKKHTEQTIVICILVIVSIAALLSSLLFYRFSLNPKKLTNGEIDYKEMKIHIQADILQEIENDEQVDPEEKEKFKKIKDPFQ